jgi:hypothetical protein
MASLQSFKKTNKLNLLVLVVRVTDRSAEQEAPFFAPNRSRSRARDYDRSVVKCRQRPPLRATRLPLCESRRPVPAQKLDDHLSIGQRPTGVTI